MRLSMRPTYTEQLFTLINKSPRQVGILRNYTDLHLLQVSKVDHLYYFT